MSQDKHQASRALRIFLIFLITQEIEKDKYEGAFVAMNIALIDKTNGESKLLRVTQLSRYSVRQEL